MQSTAGTTPSPPTVRTLACHAALHGAVLQYFTCDLANEPFTRHLVPDGSVDLLFSLDDSRGERPGAIEPALCAAGAVTTPVAVRRPAGSRLIGVSFAPGSAGAFLGIPIHQLTDRICDLRELWGPEAGELLDRLREAATPTARAALLDAVLLRKRARARTSDPVLAAGVELIRSHGGRLSMRALADELEVSERRLERLFLAGVGVSPKKLSRIARLHTVLERLARPSASQPSWGALAVELGFADQAHMIREFRSLAGTTPAGFVRDAGRSHTFGAGLSIQRDAVHCPARTARAARRPPAAPARS